MAERGLTIGEGRLVNQVVLLGDGTEFTLGAPGTRRHARKLRKYVRARMKNEPAFYEAFQHNYTKRGVLRAERL